MADDFGGDDPVGEGSLAPGAAGDPEAAGGHIDFEEFGTVVEIDVDRKIDGHVGSSSLPKAIAASYVQLKAVFTICIF
jgi:hypothetical protein